MRSKLVHVLLALVVCAPAAVRADGPRLYHDARPAMGTTFDVYLYTTSDERANELFDACFDEIERIEAAFSNYRPTSELSRINANAPNGPVVTDAEVFGLLERSLAFSRESDGAFDVTVGQLMKAWGFFKGSGHFPTDAELAEARAETGWERVHLDAVDRSIRYDGRVLLDVGAIGKGYAVDRVAALLREQGVTAALVGSGSSSIYALGAPPNTSGWRVDVPDPTDRARTLGTIEISDRSVSTSGSYEKFFTLDGRRYCHIMDPRTGRPVQGMLQTTVVTPSATDSDALSTAIFVLGPTAGADLIRRRSDASALFVTDRTGPSRVVRVRWPDH